MNKWLHQPIPPLSPIYTDAVDSLAPILIAPFRKIDRESKPLTANNRVFRVDTSATLPFLSLFGVLGSIRRKRVKFPHVRIVYGNADTEWSETLIVYRGGVFVLCGTRSEMAAIRALQMFRIELEQAGISIGLTTFTSVNVVVNVSMPFDIDIIGANASRQLPNSSLRQSDFPGMIFTMGNVQALAFANGRCVLTGADDFLQMEVVRVLVHDALLPFALPRQTIVKRHSTGTKRSPKNGIKSKAGKRVSTKQNPPVASALPKSNLRRGKRVRGTVNTTPVSTEDNRSGARKRGVAFRITEKLTLHPNLDVDETPVIMPDSLQNSSPKNLSSHLSFAAFGLQ